MVKMTMLNFHSYLHLQKQSEIISSWIRAFSVTRKGFLVITVPFTLRLRSLMAIEVADILHRENIHNSKFLTEVESDSSSKAAIARESSRSCREPHLCSASTALALSHHTLASHTCPQSLGWSGSLACDVLSQGWLDSAVMLAPVVLGRRS